MKKSRKGLRSFLLLDCCGEIAKPIGISNDLIESNLLIGLKSVKAKNISCIKGVIIFYGGPFRFVTNWNPLISIARGEIEIVGDNQNVRYSLSFKYGHILSFIGSVFISIPLGSSSTYSIGEVIIFSVTIYTTMLLGNVFYSLSNFKLLVKEALTKKKY